MEGQEKQKSGWVGKRRRGRRGKWAVEKEGKKGKVKVFVEKAENRGEEMDGQRPFPPPPPPLRFTDRTSEVRARSAPLMG